jgi:hypothetical protein
VSYVTVNPREVSCRGTPCRGAGTPRGDLRPVPPPRRARIRARTPARSSEVEDRLRRIDDGLGDRVRIARPAAQGHVACSLGEQRQPARMIADILTAARIYE